METQNDFTQPTKQKTARDNFLIPVAILIGFGMIAAAIFFSSRGESKQVAIKDANEVQQAASLENINPITAEDHVLGDPNAPVVIVEYSDFDCPFCKNFHETMNAIIDKYGVDGDVAWVYRHNPIPSLHPNAARVALASECVAGLGGNDAFWKFSDLAFSERDVNEPTDILRLEEFAVAAGVDATEFNTCLNSDKYRDEVEADVKNAAAIGANGTPFSVIMVGDQMGVINGAQPYEVVDGIVSDIVSQLP